MRNWLRQIRESKSMTQECVAQNACISRGYYARIEGGDYKVPTDTAKRIGAALGFPWTRFFEEEE